MWACAHTSDFIWCNCAFDWSLFCVRCDDSVSSIRFSFELIAKLIQGHSWTVFVRQTSSPVSVYHTYAVSDEMFCPFNWSRRAPSHVFVPLPIQQKLGFCASQTNDWDRLYWYFIFFKWKRKTWTEFMVKNGLVRPLFGWYYNGQHLCTVCAGERKKVWISINRSDRHYGQSCYKRKKIH